MMKFSVLCTSNSELYKATHDIGLLKTEIHHILISSQGSVKSINTHQFINIETKILVPSISSQTSPNPLTTQE
ncbi:hypothetical protein Hanom_Chr11g00982591 [Helianthus anomalus]